METRRGGRGGNESRGPPPPLPTSRDGGDRAEEGRVGGFPSAFVFPLGIPPFLSADLCMCKCTAWVVYRSL